MIRLRSEEWGLGVHEIAGLMGLGVEVVEAVVVADFRARRERRRRVEERSEMEEFDGRPGCDQQ